MVKDSVYTDRMRWSIAGPHRISFMPAYKESVRPESKHVDSKSLSPVKLQTPKHKLNIDLSDDKDKQIRRNLTSCDLRSTSKSNGKSPIKGYKKRKSRLSAVKSNDHILIFNKMSTCDTDKI